MKDICSTGARREERVLGHGRFTKVRPLAVGTGSARRSTTAKGGRSRSTSGPLPRYGVCPQLSGRAETPGLQDEVGGFFQELPSELDKEKPVIVCGTLTWPTSEIDLKNPGPNRGSAGFSDEEREKFSSLVDSGFTDTFRALHPGLTAHIPGGRTGSAPATRTRGGG